MTDPLVEEGLRVKTDPFAKATPRPWAFCEIGDYDDFDGNSRVLIGGDMRIAVVHAGGPNAEENEANAALIVAAVNAYGQPTELERKLTAALRMARKHYHDVAAGPGTNAVITKLDAVLTKAKEWGL